MFLIVLFIVLLLGAFSFFPAYYYRHALVARHWSWLYYVALLVGAVLGVSGASHHHESASHTRRYIGYPLPYVVFQLEDGRWVDYVPGATGLLAGWGGNFLCATALLASPFTFYCLALAGSRFYAARSTRRA